MTTETMTKDDARETARRFTLRPATADDAELLRNVESLIVIAREAGYQADYELLCETRETLRG